MHTITIIVVVFVILCLLALYGGVFWAIRYDAYHPDWYKQKDTNADHTRAQARNTTDA